MPLHSGSVPGEYIISPTPLPSCFDPLQPSLDLSNRTIVTNCKTDILTNCPHPIGFFVLASDDRRCTDVVVDAPCNSWDCKYCGPKKKQKLLLRISRNYAGEKCTMITLTLQKDVPFDRELLQTAWARLRARLAKEDFKLTFVKLKQFTKNGTRHLHVLVKGNFPWTKTQLSRVWLEVTNGTSWVVDTGRHDYEIKNAAAYSSRYVTRAITTHKFCWNERRYTTSRDVTQLPKTPSGVRWRFVVDRELSRQDLAERTEGKISRWEYLNRFLMDKIRSGDWDRQHLEFWTDVPGPPTKNIQWCGEWLEVPL